MEIRKEGQIEKNLHNRQKLYLKDLRKIKVDTNLNDDMFALKQVYQEAKQICNDDLR